MNIKEVMQKLDDYFDLSNKKQKEKHDKLLQIITRLEQKKSELKTEMIIESEKDNTSEEFHDLQKELKVIARLLKKARQHDAPEEEY
jgi:coenzyme F420-reducing hydrogenase delta subunit